ncbi:MAG TPA: translation elongation factor Ts [Ferrovibrio sp.]|uniref:translation elongation factor Ts n=1 Tax=Ferrovibrio sp. TaxID=1917215 RepID=UPI002B4B5D74|nr:translation elongation factor Ts [Ferrovibrio sp.]HLT79315.1 translation elongation factor Ts [Ferrovibrio sp.]
MAEITAALVKDLREKTGAGMMDCKKALAETNGDLDAAIDWLRKKGLSAAAKKAGRVAAEGLVAVAIKDNAGAIVEVNAETDFVARNPQFQALATGIASVVLTAGDDLATVEAAAFPGTGRNVKDEVTQAIATIGENMTLRRAKKMTVDGGIVVSYVHSALGEGIGKLGVLVGLKSTGKREVLEQIGKQLAMHIAAANPQSLSVKDLDQALVERERSVLTEQAAGSGKPADIIAKMVEGRIRKFYQEVVLLEQTFVIDGETPVGKAVEKAAKDAGAPIEVTGFVRYQLGEGIEKKADDFAAEVAKMAG